MPVISLKKALRGKPVPNKLHYEFCHLISLLSPSLIFSLHSYFPLQNLLCKTEKLSAMSHYQDVVSCPFNFAASPFMTEREPCLYTDTGTHIDTTVDSNATPCVTG